jgi:hypothetical protein
MLLKYHTTIIRPNLCHSSILKISVRTLAHQPSFAHSECNEKETDGQIGHDSQNSAEHSKSHLSKSTDKWIAPPFNYSMRSLKNPPTVFGASSKSWLLLENGWRHDRVGSCSVLQVNVFGYPRRPELYPRRRKSLVSGESNTRLSSSMWSHSCPISPLCGRLEESFASPKKELIDSWSPILIAGRNVFDWRSTGIDRSYFRPISSNKTLNSMASILRDCSSNP